MANAPLIHVWKPSDSFISLLLFVAFKFNKQENDKMIWKSGIFIKSYKKHPNTKWISMSQFTTGRQFL